MEYVKYDITIRLHKSHSFHIGLKIYKEKSYNIEQVIVYIHADHSK